MKRPLSHETDELAQRFFRSALPPGWVVREQIPDYGIDFLVEVFEQEMPTGLVFAVQLKGTKSLRRQGGVPCLSLKVSHLAYYVDSVQQPVFLVLVDLVRKRGYWLFLQSFALDTLGGKTWRKQYTVTVKPPKSNTLANTRRLRQAIREATKRMAELHPAAIEGAIAAERKRVQSRDPRFNVKIDVEDSCVHYKLEPRETVRGTFTIKGPRDVVLSKVDDLMRGLPVSFTPGQMTVSDLPLFEEASGSEVTLQCSHQIPASVSLIAQDAAGAEIATIHHIPGDFTGGPRESRFKGGLPESPLSVQLGLSRANTPPATPLAIHFDLGLWYGKPVTQLAFYDQIESVFGAADRISSLELKFFAQGRHIVTGKFTRENLSSSRQFQKALRLLKQAREVASHFGVQPSVPQGLSNVHAREIEQLHQLITVGQYRSKRRGVSFKLTITLEGLRDFLNKSQDDPLAGPFKANRDKTAFPFLGLNIELGPIEYELTHPRLRPGREALLRTVTEGSGETTVFEIIDSDESELIMRIANAT